MKATVKVSHLRTDDALYCRGDIIDFPEERIMQLGSSVERIDAIVETPQETEDEPEVVDSADTEEEPVEPEVVDSADTEEEPVEADKQKPKRGRPKR